MALATEVLAWDTLGRPRRVSKIVTNEQDEIDAFVGRCVRTWIKEEPDDLIIKIRSWDPEIQDANGRVSIDVLFDAFHKFNQGAIQLNQQGLYRKPEEWNRRMGELQEEFKRSVGSLAEHIDWSQRD